MDMQFILKSDSSGRILDKLGKVTECSEREHPYPEEVIMGFQPGRNVFVQCTNCNGFYERPPTGKEVADYSKILKLEIRALMPAYW